MPDELEREPGVLVALNDDYDEQNLIDDTLFVGPNHTAVSVLVRAADNQLDRIPEEGREHHIAASWQLAWFSDSGESNWQSTMDDEVRPAIVTSNVRGSVTFDVPSHAKLWVPAWAYMASMRRRALRLPGALGRDGSKCLKGNRISLITDPGTPSCH